LDTIIQFLEQSQMLRISLEDWGGGKSLLIGKKFSTPVPAFFKS